MTSNQHSSLDELFVPRDELLTVLEQRFLAKEGTPWQEVEELEARAFALIKSLYEQLEAAEQRNRIALEHARKGAKWNSSGPFTAEDAARFHGALIFVIANLDGTLDGVPQNSNPA